MSKRQQPKGRKSKCLSCGTNYDRARYPGGCPTCQRDRMQELFAAIRRGSQT